MSRLINKDTRLCISLAGRPSNIGTRFHNFLYDQLDLDFIYKACTTEDLAAAIAGIRGLGIRGCGVSMPYKEACIPYLDELDQSANTLQSVNTIVNDDGYLRAYNTDFIAIAKLLAVSGLSSELSFALRGSGGMAKAVAGALYDAGFRSGIILARNAITGRALAETHGYRWQTELGETRPELLINATPIGMAGGPAADTLAFEPAIVNAAVAVFDVVALPPETPLVHFARSQQKPVITGAEVIALQAAEQFVLYTGARPSEEQIRRASEYARA
ncbi:MAG TPA: shikimate 5-dehydrogenase [Chromatiaceae bacterium]|jgi:shikimate dehydrogenase|nr:MAG: shikimate 5-dehydrogenase [Thiohalocapsa sp. PB-PSB1]HBG95616.1 shikimate 5-dehydrogenase [Chromatiaceae bacterium]HCS88494.1 shikimate 5-dehydrogenase [Chromatiaceae bacterium]